jgi:hypothetical protein
MDAFQLGDPREHRGIVLTPLYPRRDPVCRYVPLDEALPLGFRVTEVDAEGSVPELRAVNPTRVRVLLYDGEELVGAKQNRVLNVTVLVETGSEVTIPVSCVEEGRWHDRGEAFAAAGHVSDPELRRRKNALLAAAPLARGAAQHEVWRHVREKALRLGASSPTAAHADTYAARERELEALREAFPVTPGQSGAVLALPNGALCLDWVSRPDAFATLYPKLLAGYLLDALEHLDAPARTDGAEELARGVRAAAVTRAPSAGLGDDVRLHAPGLVGSSLELDGELLQLSAFADVDGPRAGRIARPSRRRR